VVPSAVDQRITPNERGARMKRQTRQYVAGICGGFSMGLLVGAWVGGGSNILFVMLTAAVLTLVSALVRLVAQRVEEQSGSTQ
jgi:asparagine N-glycosylation enzyme membrane subunit Stt3